MKLLLSLLLSLLCFVAYAKNPVVVMKTTKGDILIELNKEKAPISTKNFLKYVADKKYDGTIYHRVIDNFMIQGGGFTPDFKKVGTYPAIKNEAKNGLKNDIGTIAMARTSDINSATNQFFINVANNEFLNYKNNNQFGYAVFGKVIKGMSVVKVIQKVRKAPRGGHGDVPVENILIKSIRLK